MFDDDYATDNKIQLNAKLTGASTVKFNAVGTSQLKNGEPVHSVVDDFQLDTKAHGVGLQLKFKPNLVSFHADFGQFNKVTTCGKNNHVYSIWNNPYVFFEFSRGCRLNSYFLGNLTHINKCTRNNVG